MHIDKSSKLIIHKGNLSINRKWAFNDPAKTLFNIGKNSVVEVGGTFDIYSGAQIYVNDGAYLYLGSGYINQNAHISVFCGLKIGEHCVISENVSIRDSDNHTIIVDEKKSSPNSPIEIGNHVWVGMNVTILKGVTIGDGAVVAAGSVVISNVPPHSLVAGNPAKVKKEGIEWE